MVVLKPLQRGLREQLAQLWRYRSLFGYFGDRFLKKRYARTWLGWTWLVLRPALTVGSGAIVFGGVLGVATGAVPYLLFFLVASAAWQLFAETAYWATRSLELSRRELRQMYIPRLIPLCAALVPSVVDYLVYGAITVCALAYYWAADGVFYLELRPASFAVLAGLAMVALFGLGIGLWAAPYAARARDVRFGLGFVLSFWYFLTPVIYPIDAIPSAYRELARVNPMTTPVELVKYGLLGSGDISAQGLAVTLATIALVVGGGLRFFAGLERASLDSA